ncbi:Clavaminate synthase-like protein [Rhizodiscina lignyota]|uniref:Clavaminate synthase-like protein n=1 Tax=Rhizodiscina lignyota TaxID=1504668 RepID=A0A9P4IKM6_9PEZI|nr:Clavaminate synthase-like protein [Rhizodiscina lignyota]
MPAAKALAEVDHFEPVKPSKEPIDFVKLRTLDFSKYNDGPEARKELASIVRDAMTTKGFFTLINHGISEEEITRQVDIGHTILKRTPPEEKLRLKAQILEKGSYPGFKLRGLWNVGSDAKDRIENFNVYRVMSQNEQPRALEPYRHEIQDFIDFIHKDILKKLLTLFALALELADEDYFVNAHSYEGHDESWLRYMEYEAHHDDRDSGGKTLWLNGHKDFPALSLLFSQPMTTLQVRDEHDEDSWKYVAHTPGAIIVNAGEIMSWWTGDYFKAAIHRVVEPPRDQMGHDRSSVFYFTVPNDDVVINTLLDQSPVLREAGVAMAYAPEDAPTSKQWCNARVKLTGQSKQAANGKTGTVVEKVIGNVTTAWFK